MNSISRRIKYYRNAKGLTQMEVANALGIRTDNYAKYESGARTPKDDRMIALSKILGVSYTALYEGVERGFADLLGRHAVSAVLGDVEAFRAFAGDMEASIEAYSIVDSFFGRGVHHFVAENHVIFEKYISRPNLPGLIALYDIYKERFASRPREQTEIKYDTELTPNENLMKLITLPPHISAKWAFCTAVHRYLKTNDIESVLREAGESAGELDALQYFAVKVFVPYLAFIIEAAQLCANTAIDDFDKAFRDKALSEFSLYDFVDGGGDEDE